MTPKVCKERENRSHERTEWQPIHKHCPVCKTYCAATVNAANKIIYKPVLYTVSEVDRIMEEAYKEIANEALTSHGEKRPNWIILLRYQLRVLKGLKKYFFTVNKEPDFSKDKTPVTHSSSPTIYSIMAPRSKHRSDS